MDVDTLGSYLIYDENGLKVPSQFVGAGMNELQRFAKRDLARR